MPAEVKPARMSARLMVKAFEHAGQTILRQTDQSSFTFEFFFLSSRTEQHFAFGFAILEYIQYAIASRVKRARSLHLKRQKKFGER